VSFAATTLCVASQRVFIIIVVYLPTQSGNFRILPSYFIVPFSDKKKKAHYEEDWALIRTVIADQVGIKF
jgi:hypothetical protein